MDLRRQAQHALVTGSTAGIGYAIAQALAAEGATVTLNGRSAASVDKALARLRAELPGASLRGIAADAAMTVNSVLPGPSLTDGATDIATAPFHQAEGSGGNGRLCVPPARCGHQRRRTARRRRRGAQPGLRLPNVAIFQE